MRLFREFLEEQKAKSKEFRDTYDIVLAETHKEMIKALLQEKNHEKRPPNY